MQINYFTLGYSSIRTLMNAHCVRYGTIKSVLEIFCFKDGGFLVLKDTNISICRLFFELTKFTIEFSFSGSSSYCTNKMYTYYYD